MQVHSYIIRVTFNFDGGFCFLATVQCPTIKLHPVESHLRFPFFSLSPKITNIQNAWYQSRQFNIIFFFIVNQEREKSVLAWGMNGEKSQMLFFHLMICHKFMTRISCWIRTYFCCFTKFPTTNCRLHLILSAWWWYIHKHTVYWIMFRIHKIHLNVNLLEFRKNAGIEDTWPAIVWWFFPIRFYLCRSNTMNTEENEVYVLHACVCV